MSVDDARVNEIAATFRQDWAAEFESLAVDMEIAPFPGAVEAAAKLRAFTAAGLASLSDDDVRRLSRYRAELEKQRRTATVHNHYRHDP